MIYLITGDGYDETKKIKVSLIQTLKNKKPNAEIFSFDSTNWSEAKLEESLGGQGLFESKYIIIVDNLFSDESAKDFLISKLEDFKKSPNVFVVVEYALKIAEKNLIKKFAEKNWDIKSAIKLKPEFNIFSLTDAFAERNKTKLWILFQQAVDSGAEPEEISGLLFWQAKSLVIASKTNSPNEAGLKPFVFSKAKRFLKNYSPNELQNNLKKLVDLYHNAHNGLLDFKVGLEEFLLTI